MAAVPARDRLPATADQRATRRVAELRSVREAAVSLLRTGRPRKVVAARRRLIGTTSEANNRQSEQVGGGNRHPAESSSGLGVMDADPYRGGVLRWRSHTSDVLSKMIPCELHISSRDKDSRTLLEALLRFAHESGDYEPLPKQTEQYRQMISADAFVVQAVHSEPLPALHFASSDGATFELTNIIPKTVSSIDMAEYNRFAEHFRKRLSSFSRRNGLGVRMKATSGELTLESAISGPKTRKRFEQFLAAHPTSRHGHDVRRLDIFICTASRHAAGTVNVHRLHRYLREILEWNESDAEWCSDRVRIGLEVLEANRSF